MGDYDKRLGFVGQAKVVEGTKIRHLEVDLGFAYFEYIEARQGYTAYNRPIEKAGLLVLNLILDSFFTEIQHCRLFWIIERCRRINSQNLSCFSSQSLPQIQFFFLAIWLLSISLVVPYQWYEVILFPATERSCAYPIFWKGPLIIPSHFHFIFTPSYTKSSFFRISSHSAKAT